MSVPSDHIAGLSPLAPPERRIGLELRAYRAATRLARPAAAVILRLRERRGKEDPARLGERLGEASLPRPPGPLAWVHAASVGEVSSVMPLVAVLRERRPGLGVLVTTGTVTSARLAAARLPGGAMHQFVPLDAPQFVARFLDHWRPSVAVFTEQEIWPNLVVEASARRIPLAVVNARMSETSFLRWQRRPRLAAELIGRFGLVLAQSEAIADRFAALGARRVHPIGNLKIDAPPPPVDAAALAVLEGALAGRPHLLAASTHAGEETVLAEAHVELTRRAPGFVTIIAPRHADRGPEIAARLGGLGLSVARRAAGALPAAGTDVYIADTMGELGTFYAASPVAFVGGSLIAHGGQNPIEAVRRASVVLTGPSRTNFEGPYSALLAAEGAFEVRDAGDIVSRTGALLASPDALAAARRNADRALATLSGALERTVAALLPLLPDEEPARAP